MVQHTTVEGRRKHLTPYGQLPGVTTVLSNTKDARSVAAIEAWKQRVGEEEAERIKNEACDRGTKLHNTIESYLESPTTPLKMDESIFPLFKLLRPLLDDLDEVLHIEVDTYHPLGYGGSADLIAIKNGKPIVFDWKTSTKPKKRSYIKDYILQVCAYISSANYVLGTNINRGMIVVVTPGAAKRQEFRITPAQYEKGWEEFKQRLALYQQKFPNSVF